EGGIDLFWASSTAPRFESSRHQLLSLPGSVMTSITAGSFNSEYELSNDTLLDLAVVNQSSSQVEIYYQQAGAIKFLPGSFQLLNVLPGISEVGSGDMDGDGADDIMASTIEGVYLYLQSPTFVYGFSDSQDVHVLSVAEDLLGFAIGDLDDDGEMELAVTTASSTVLAYGFGSSTFHEMTRQTVGASPALLLIGDADGDLKDDLVAYSVPSRCVSFYYQNNFAPVAVGEYEGSGHLEGLPVWFNAYASTDNHSDQKRLTFTWDFGDGAMGSGNRTSHEFQDNGTYNVVLNVSDLWGGWDEVVIPITIGDQAPTANFTYQQAPAPIEGLPVSFHDLSTSPADDILSWSWNFGDGQWSNRTNNETVQNTYGRNGTYTVTLTVIDEDGSEDSASMNITVLDSSPNADFSASNYSPIEGQDVTFTDLSEFTADNIVRWSWDLGDGTWVNRTSGDAFQHTYVLNGTYQVTLVVRDIDGSEDSVTKQIMVQDSAPVSGFSLSITSPFEGEDVTFTDTSTFPFNQIVSWSWDLGDGTTSFVKGPLNHHYEDNGTYTVTLTVTDEDGNVDVSSMTVVVKDTSPIISGLFTSDGASSYKEWDEVVLEVAATYQWDDIVRYQWDFQTVAFQADDETEFNSTEHRYNSSGTYRITVRVWDSDSFTDASIQIAITDPAPVPDFIAASTDNDREVSFSAALTLDTENDQPWLRYRWNFGDGQLTDWSLSYVVNHTYQQDGVYSVRLEVRDDRNPSVMKTVNVTIDLLPPVISMDDPVL
ncbi:MAG: PKD domain-containing protein, partial [Euryarchaeota archaeon]|nr:PKD domain-containing protein [Euryarchaeota archaeon]